MAGIIIAADFGTTGVKLGAVDRDFRLLGCVAEPYGIRVDSAAGLAEQTPSDWSAALMRGVARLSADVPRLREEAAALVFCAQMCGVVCCDASGAPLRPCLIWLDKRAAGAARRLVGGIPSFEGYGVSKLARWLVVANGAPSLNGADPPAKMKWLQENEPAVWKAADKLLDVRDWLLFQATGYAVTTADCANLTWMMDSRKGRMRWSPTLRRLVGVEARLLPKIIDGSHIAGGLQADFAKRLGLPGGLPVVAGSGDVCAAALGTGAVADGQFHIYLGTSSWIGGFFPQRRLSVRHHYATIASAAQGKPLLIATQETAGACLHWAARMLVPDQSPGGAVEELLRAIQAAPAPQQHDPMFLPWLTGERMPVDDERLRAGLLGVSLAHDRRHLARAVAEGVALNLRWAFESIGGARDAKSEAIPVAGKLAGSRVFVQLLADVLQQPLRMLAHPEFAGLLGVSTFAATALGWTSSPFDAARRLPQGTALIQPDRGRAPFYTRRLERFRHAWRSTKGWYRRGFA